MLKPSVNAVKKRSLPPSWICPCSWLSIEMSTLLFIKVFFHFNSLIPSIWKHTYTFLSCSVIHETWLPVPAWLHSHIWSSTEISHESPCTLCFWISNIFLFFIREKNKVGSSKPFTWLQNRRERLKSISSMCRWVCADLCNDLVLSSLDAH